MSVQTPEDLLRRYRETLRKVAAVHHLMSPEGKRAYSRALKRVKKQLRERKQPGHDTNTAG